MTDSSPSPGRGPASAAARPTWERDILGDGYEYLSLPLGTDPDGEGEISATLVRYQPAGGPTPTRAVLYTHGYTDYFFQTHLAEHFAAQGIAFFALDLRKCGRSIRAGHTPHYVSDLALYDQELNAALEVIRELTGGPVVVAAHSTGGLVISLWLHRLARAGASSDIAGALLNSPWLDLQGPAYLRTVATPLVRAVGRWRGYTIVHPADIDTYGMSIHVSGHGEWNYELAWKPLAGFPPRLGWLRAIRDGHATLHQGLDIGVPALVLRSARSSFSRTYRPAAASADTVLDVRQIQRWSGCLGQRTTIVPIEGALHDVFLSAAAPRQQAFAELDRWLAELPALSTAQPIS